MEDQADWYATSNELAASVSDHIDREIPELARLAREGCAPVVRLICPRRHPAGRIRLAGDPSADFGSLTLMVVDKAGASVDRTSPASATTIRQASKLDAPATDTRVAEVPLLARIECFQCQRQVERGKLPSGYRATIRRAVLLLGYADAYRRGVTDVDLFELEHRR